MLSSGCKHLGVTATPDRSDEFALGKVYEEAPYVYELPDAVRDGWLVPIQQDIVRVTGLDYSNVKVTAGDLNQGDVAKAMGSERVLQGMCDAIVQLSGDKKAIVFATPGSMKIGNDKFHIADRVEEIFNRHKPGCAARVSQDTPKDLRREILNDYRNGKFQYLINVGVFTEGFDEPGVEIVAILRPTKSRSLYAQMVGRGTRPLPGVVDGVDRAEARRAAIANSSKPRVRVIDFAGNSGKHKLVTSADILGGNYEDRVVERAKQKAEKGSVDMQDALIEAMQEFRREDEDRKRRSKVIGKAEFVVQSIDPFDIFDISPNRLRGWEIGKGATPKQINMLSGFGIDGKDLTMGHASQLIDECMRRKNAGIVGFNQAMKLHEKGLSTDMSAAQASIALGGRLRSVSERWKEMESR
jgi:superfamily II DNA or RNA helicase